MNAAHLLYRSALCSSSMKDRVRATQQVAVLFLHFAQHAYAEARPGNG